MGVRIQWDKYEAALLIDAFWRIEKEPILRKDIIKKLSIDLRNKAINEGKTIDDIFRNENGISMQLSPIGHAFFPNRPTLSTSKLFDDMVLLYKENHEEYEKILCEAKTKVLGMEGVKMGDRKVEFAEWLKNLDYRRLSDEAIIGSLDQASKYCVSHRISNRPIWEFGDIKQFTITMYKLLSLRTYRLMHKNQIGTLEKAISLYRRFMEDEACAIRQPQVEIGKSDSVDVNGMIPLDNLNLKKVLVSHFPYGFNIASPIELMKLKKYYCDDQSVEFSESDAELVLAIRNIGLEYAGKVYIIEDAVINLICEDITNYKNSNHGIIYYSEFFVQKEDWLFEHHIVSAEMLKGVLEKYMPENKYKANYFLLESTKNNEQEALNQEVIRVWGGQKLRTFDELSKLLPMIPMEKIKYVLAARTIFVWNSYETYTRRDLFVISDEQRKNIIDTAREICLEKGTVSFEDLPIIDVASENYEISETALYDVLFGFLESDFSRNGKAVALKGTEISVEVAIVQYCREHQKCTMGDLENVMREYAGEVRYPVVIEAANSAMIRIDKDTFVADTMVNFDVEAIDAALNTMITKEVIGIKEIISFGTMPYCGFTWNLFVLESYCRRISNSFRYDCLTPNSRNAGAIIRREFKGSYHEIMAKAVAESGVCLTEKAVFDYLIDAGLMLRRQYSEINELISLAENYREGK